MNKTFKLTYPNNSTITIGTNGIQIVQYNDAGWSIETISVLFDKIHNISDVTVSQAGF